MFNYPDYKMPSWRSLRMINHQPGKPAILLRALKRHLPVNSRYRSANLHQIDVLAFFTGAIHAQMKACWDGAEFFQRTGLT